MCVVCASMCRQGSARLPCMCVMCVMCVHVSVCMHVCVCCAVYVLSCRWSGLCANVCACVCVCTEGTFLSSPHLSSIVLCAVLSCCPLMLCECAVCAVVLCTRCVLACVSCAQEDTNKSRVCFDICWCLHMTSVCCLWVL